VVAPYDAQAEEIYVKAKQILNNLNEPYDEIVESAKESPNYQIKLRNGSRLRCFTAGSSGAAQVRGQPANLIYIDEVDYLGQKTNLFPKNIMGDYPILPRAASTLCAKILHADPWFLPILLLNHILRL
jgi:hypothetical protein